MKMIRWLWVCLLIGQFPIKAFGINAVVSHSIFYMPGENNSFSKPYIEINWQIDPASVRYTKSENENWQAKIQCNLVVKCDTGIIAQNRYILQTTPVEKNLVLNQNISDLHRYAVSIGKLTYSLQFIDVADKENVFSYKDSLDVEPASGNVYYSDIQILDTIYDITTETKYLKNSRQQIPLSTNFLDDSRRLIHLYTELYHLEKVDEIHWPLRQIVSISKKMYENSIYKLESTDTISNRVAIMPFISHFDISVLPSGNYYANTVLLDKDGNKLATKSLFFQRSNKNPVALENKEQVQDTGFIKVNVFDLSETFVAKYTMPQLKAILKMLIPISSPIEADAIRGFAQRPDETYMRYFIYNFWKNKSPTDPKQAWDDYANLVREVNKMFGSGRLPGYETERGIIYLKYGKPNERIIVENEQGALPYEIWQYNSVGKVQSTQGLFLFYRPAYMINDFALLHTTVKGEVRNANWPILLYTSGSSSSTNSRAAQYFTR
jgi:GWxTD domain-containing protein